MTDGSERNVSDLFWYEGNLYSSEGPPLGAPFDAARVKATQVGSASFDDSGGQARFSWTLPSKSGAVVVRPLPY